ncbi:MAG: 2-oxo acid dehydrogenase subunit E2 [Cyanobacteria bacterium HKST-UBA04]|nr:2-oxo acid dehydrogenase subunit E2 [Cyanobacteria bacterium HKST-UBA04]MCA9842357.1 2-oxo acid dehydrogenase subunit E2 [Cyanobacteria bacterium HKST-UBA03]
MVYEFKLPDIGEGVHEGEIAKWHVEEGQPVTEDDPMVEVMTDKVTVVITAPVSGIVAALMFSEGDVAHVGDVIISINEQGQSAATTATAAEPAEAPAKQACAAEQTVAAPRPQPQPVAVAGSAGTTTTAKSLAAPAARKLARDLQVDLAQVPGSGPRGRIRKPDVEAFAQTAHTAQTAQPAAPAAKSASPNRRQGTPGVTEERIPYRGMRRKIGDHLVAAKHTAPHFTYVEEADFTQLVAIRRDLDAEARAMTDGQVKVTYLPFIIKAVIAAMAQYPVLNSSLDEAASEIVLKYDYNIGVAVATDQGLVVPVIHHADQLNLLQLSEAIGTLSQKARANQLTLDDVQGGTFTLTSIGSIGGIFSAPIVNVPEVAIMGIQKIEPRPVVVDNEIVIRDRSYLSISCDHRVVDGAEAALFMKAVVEILEHPARMLLGC